MVHLSNGVSVVACANKIVLMRNKQKVAAININYEATCIAAKSNVSEFAVGANDSKVHIYELTPELSVSAVKTLNERDAISTLSYSPDDRYLAVADAKKLVKCYRLTDDRNYEEITREMWQHHAAKVTSLSWSPDSKHLASTSVDTHVWIYSTESPMKYMQIKSK